MTKWLSWSDTPMGQRPGEFYKSIGWIFHHFRFTLMSHFGYFEFMRVALGHFWITLVSLWASFELTLDIWGWPWIALIHFEVTLRSLCGPFGAFLAYENDFGALWGYFGMTLSSLSSRLKLRFGTLLAYEDDFGIIVVSSWVYEYQSSRITHVPHEF